MERKKEKEKLTEGTAIVELYKIMRGMQRLGKEQKLIASSNKGQREQKLKADVFFWKLHPLDC